MNDRLELAPIVKVVAGPFQPNTYCEVASVSYTAGGLAIRMESKVGTFDVAFTSVWGFRVLDELDLTEFWSQCSLKTGWLFEVLEGGWKALELHRAHFVSGCIHEDLREFLVIGVDDCVSVLSKDEPFIQMAMV